jgi:hypothetical protein
MMRRPPAVRIATPADIEPLFWMVMRDLGADNPMGVPVSPKKILALVKLCCNGNGGVAGVIESRGVIIGSAGVVVAQHDLSDTDFLKQIWLFVTPSARKGHPEHADKLFRFCLWHKGDMSRRLGYDVPLEISVMSRKRLPAKLRVWGRYGEMIGAVFWARDKDEHGQQIDHHPTDAALPGDAGGLQRDTVARR